MAKAAMQGAADLEKIRRYMKEQHVPYTDVEG
jgi:hypothetical protein